MRFEQQPFAHLMLVVPSSISMGAWIDKMGPQEVGQREAGPKAKNGLAHKPRNSLKLSSGP